MTNTAFSQYQQNIQRQSREQKAVGSMLSGVAVVLIALIALVGVLASVGGYFLYKAIQDQSVTVNQLQGKIDTENLKLHTAIQESDVAVENLTAQVNSQKEQISALQRQLDDFRSQFKKQRLADQARQQKLEIRLYELERQAIAQ